MFHYGSVPNLAAIVWFFSGVIASAVEPGAIADSTMIPPDQMDEIRYLDNGRGVARLADPALVYDNHQNEYTCLRIPGESSPPYWLAEDVELGNLPSYVTEWEITGYGYLTYAFEGTAPYEVTSRLYRFDVCTSTPTPLVEWTTGHCCVDPIAFGGTEAVFTIPYDGMVEVTYDLPAPVVVDKYFLMYLEYSGANVAGNAGWIVAGDPEVGFTDDRWAEDFLNDGLRCWEIWFGRGPFTGFRAFVYGTSAAVMELLPPDPAGPGGNPPASGNYAVVGNEIFLDCHDLPAFVTFDVMARDWDPHLAKGFQTRIGCDSYYTAPQGTLTAVTENCSFAPPCDPFEMGIDLGRSDILCILLAQRYACDTQYLCPDGVSGWHTCLGGCLNNVPYVGMAKYLNHYSFEVSADTKGTWIVSLDPRTLYTQFSDLNATPIFPLARPPGLITVEMGKCCYDIDPWTSQCTDGVTECECEVLPAPRVFFVGEQCTGESDECDLGACCLLDGTCQEHTTASQCAALAGEDAFLGILSECLGDGDGNGHDDACEPPELLGACCMPNDTCQDGMTVGYCTAAAGEGAFAGPGTACLGDGDGDGYDDACEPPELLGACCLPDGGCLDGVTEGHCVALAGADAFLGLGTECLGDSNGNGINDACDPYYQVPVASEWGLLILALLLLTLGKVYVGQHRRALNP